MMLLEQAQLPEAAVSRAFRAVNGEFAWRRSDLSSAAQELVNGHLAIVGGEVWVVEGTLFGSLSPGRDGGWLVMAWDVPEREQGETWSHYAQRTLEWTLQVVRSLNAEANVAPEVADKLYYHLSFADESGYKSYKRVAV